MMSKLLSKEACGDVDLMRRVFLVVLEEKIKGFDGLIFITSENETKRSFYTDRRQAWVNIHGRVRAGLKLARNSEAGDLFAAVYQQMGFRSDYGMVSSFFLEG